MAVRSSSRGVAGRPRAVFFRLVVVVLVLVGLQEAGRWAARRFLIPTAEAKWIWAADVTEEDEPVAFYAVKDFSLERAPETAELFTLADEESVLFLNGEPVGASRFIDGAGLVAYEVGALLRTGANRLVTELRSTRGAGGFLLRLVSESQEGIDIISDHTWRIYRQAEVGILDPATVLSQGESPQVWGAPPLGRWSLTRRPRVLPTIQQLRVSDRAAYPERLLITRDRSRWAPLGKPNRHSPALGSHLTFDWGREVVGYLALRFPPEPQPDQQPIGMIFAGAKFPDTEGTTPDGFLVAMPGQRVWLDAVPRRFRYVTFVGLCELSGAEAYLVDGQRVELHTRGMRLSGAFGLPPTDPRTPFQNGIRSELERRAHAPERFDR